MRLRNIDLFKGVLILLVIWGHMIPEAIDESFWRTIIYSFHMPLFIGISGFLFNADKMIKLNLIQLIKKYRFRVIIPWGIAVIGYFIFNALATQNFSGFELVKAVVYPFYHLWFIPAFLSWVAVTWFLKKAGISHIFMLAIAFVISVTSLSLSYYPELYQEYRIINAGIKLVLHTFRPYFLFFFVLGSVLKHLELKRPRRMEYILPLLGLFLAGYLFYNPMKVLSIFNFYFLNIILLTLVVKMAANSMIRDVQSMEWVGVHSLAIYLWHVLPIFIGKFAVGTENLWLYYGTTICLEVVFILSYNYLLRYSFLRKYVFGM